MLHCVSVSNQLQQWTITFARISVQKSGERRPPASRPTAPLHRFLSLVSVHGTTLYMSVAVFTVERQCSSV